MKLGTTLAIVIFVLVAALHLYRVVAGLPVIIGEWSAPMWVSYVGTIVPLAVAFLLWKGK